MAITADQEQAFYDAAYSRFHAYSDADLAVSAAVMRSNLADPRQPVYERRRLYTAVLEVLLSHGLEGKSVLDYGCGPSDWGVFMATEGANVALLDLSSAAIELGHRRARASGVAGLVRGFARNASDLSCFADGEFDLIFASAAVHHTFKYPNAFEELLRVLRPGGTLLMAETYGNNPVLNGARKLRAAIQREAEEQGEEIIISRSEVDLLKRHFRIVELREMNLLAMAKRLLRGRLHRPWALALLCTLEAADNVIHRVFPFTRRYCGEVLIRAVR